MKESELSFDRSRHALYTKNAKKCVQSLLRRWYDEQTAADLWEKIQLQYVAFLEDAPALGGLKMTASIYDPILIFAWYAVVPDKPAPAEVQREVYECFMGAFDRLGKVLDLNRRPVNRLANLAFKNASDIRVREIGRFPASFRIGFYDYDRENGVVRYNFTQCPNAEFARKHHLEAILPAMCNCDHLAMQALHGTLIRQGTCLTSDCCDYCVVGDRNPLAAQYELVTNADGLLLSVPVQEKRS